MTEHISILNYTRDLQERLAALKSDRSALLKSREVVKNCRDGGGIFYGINTGFGGLARKRIDADQLRELQFNYLQSHAAGVGDPIPKELSRIMLELKIHSIGLGFSGVSEGTFLRLIEHLDKDLIPVVPEKGSVGASGDLAPLSHMCLPLIGLGQVWNSDGTETIPAEEGLQQHDLQPLELRAKEGLALTNGTQFMCAYGVDALRRALNLVKVADIVGLMSLDALQGSASPYDARVHELRPHPGQKAVAANGRKLLEGSRILASHGDCDKVQDPYSLRCIPQVHGASRDALEHARAVLEVEINSVTDNPLVLEDGSIISAGNFHGQPIALAFDYAAIALAELASIADRRIYLMTLGRDGLPIFLTDQGGLHSGFMIPQYTTAALVSENKVLCHPASVDSVPTSIGQEDHVSMGSIGAVKLRRVLENVERVLAIELLAAGQALDFRKPLESSPALVAAHQRLRQDVEHRGKDRIFENDIAAAHALVAGAELVAAVESKVGNLQ